MRCGIAMLFTGILVLSRSFAREGAHVKHESLEKTARYRVGQDKQGRYMTERISKRFSLTREQDHEGRICEVLHEDSCSSIYYIYDNVICVKEEMS
jgi:hypothetical protein